MSFSRPSRGGGEVEKVEYDENTGTGKITFLHPGGTPLWRGGGALCYTQHHYSSSVQYVNADMCVCSC